MNSNQTIIDVAEALGVSATTVSRAISGKGRISETTKARILAYVEEHNFKPNRVAQGLAQKRTGNICVVWPGQSDAEDLPFFQKCLLGISKAAEEADYDILVSISNGQDESALRRVIENQKADGVILTRTLTEDRPAAYLKESGIPFVAIGSSADPEVLTVDNANEEACIDLTRRMIESGLKRIVLIGGDQGYVISQTRRRGFLRAFEETGNQTRPLAIYMAARDRAGIEEAMKDALARGADGVICMDDRIATTVISLSHSGAFTLPPELRMASFYDSSVLENARPSVTALHFDDAALGRAATELLMAQIHGEPAESRMLGTYEIILRDSFYQED